MFLLYVNRLGPGGHKGGKSVHRMMSDYESMMNLSLKQIQQEIKRSICAAIKEEGRDEKEFLEELRILEGDSIEEICRNEEREFTTAIPMFIGNERWIYICIKPGIVTKYLCAWVGNMTDCYVGKVQNANEELVLI